MLLPYDPYSYNIAIHYYSFNKISQLLKTILYNLIQTKLILNPFYALENLL